MKNFSHEERIPDLTTVGNIVQAMLMERHFKGKPTKEQMLSWIDENALNFSSILDKQPKKTLKRWEEHPEEAAEIIEKELDTLN